MPPTNPAFCPAAAPLDEAEDDGEAEAEAALPDSTSACEEKLAALEDSWASPEAVAAEKSDEAEARSSDALEASEDHSWAPREVAVLTAPWPSDVMVEMAPPPLEVTTV